MKKLILALITSFLFFQTAFCQFQYEVSTLIPQDAHLIDDGLALDENGTLYGSYWGIWKGKAGEHILRYRTDGTRDTLAQGFARPNGIAYLDGKLFIANGGANELVVVDTNGIRQQAIKVPEGISNIVPVPGKDSLVIVAWGKPLLMGLNAEGTIRRLISSPLLNGAVGAAFDPEGNLYIGNFNDGKILKYSNGKVEVFAELGGGIGFLTYSEGALLVMNHTDKKIYRVSLRDAAIEVIAGSGEATIKDGIGKTASFMSPNGIVATPSGDTIYISEFAGKALRRIIRRPTSSTGFKDERSAAPNRYELDFKEDRVRVTASFESCGPELFMIIGSARESKRGQQELISYLKYKKEDKWIKLEAYEPGRWIIPGMAEQERKPIQIQYEILLDFDRLEWNSGKEEMAYQAEEAYVFSMRSLFIWPLEKYDINEAVDLVFKIPEGKNLISPWNLDDLTATQVQVPDFVDFLYNTFLIGDANVEKFKVGELDIALVCLDTLVTHQQAFKAVLRESGHFFAKNVGNKKGVYLVIYGTGIRNDGGAFEKSFSQTVHGAVNEASLPVWGGLSVHELCHLWHGRDLTFAGPEEEWILEGWADYLTILAMSNTKLITPEQALDKLENSIRKYLIAKYRISSDVSLQEAGADKGAHRMLIYGGGALAALYLDMTIRKSSEGKESLWTLMKDLFANREEKAFSTANIQQLAEALSGQRLQAFFSQYIEGKDIFPIPEMMQELGLQYDVFGYEDVGLSLVKKSQLRQEILGF